MKKITVCVSLSMLLISVSFASELLESKHGEDCSVCHEENPPKYEPYEDACLSCHGSHADIIKLTADKYPNYHESAHAGFPGVVDPCTVCHHMHKPSELSCVKCHDNIKTVPVP